MDIKKINKTLTQGRIYHRMNHKQEHHSDEAETGPKS